ncbi:MAG: hypothetical protein KBD21_02520 [Candidatus Pacebacteria bacterium]|nr:hypothetical protein [Candidatus Paceibacterota bacterium]
MISTESLLRTNSIPLNLWGQGSAKTLDHLKKEVAEGETVLVEEEGKLLRLTTVLYIIVECEVGAEWFRLREDRQEFVDGRVRRRAYMWGSLAEKMKAGECPTEGAVLRALSEEIGVSSVKSAHLLQIEVSEEESPSYPGLQARFTNHKWVVEMCPADFHPDGYVEVQPDKSTYFVWEKQ